MPLTCSALDSSRNTPPVFTINAAGATDLAASGMWTPSLRHTDLASGAGGALRGNIESAGGQVVLDIGNSAGAAWTVTVRHDGAQWPAGVQMAVRVVSIGRGAGAASAGGACLRLDGSAQVLVSGGRTCPTTSGLPAC